MAIREAVFAVIGCWLLAGALAARAADDITAHELVEVTTERVMDVVRTADDYVDEDPERYYAKIRDILDPLIDYRGFARSVMGPYATSDRYRSLDEAGRARLREQLDEFTQVMRLSLVRTYSKGLLAFGSSRFEVVAEGEQDPERSRASVRQNVFAERSEPYVVYYQMGRDGDGEWKLRNMIIESVNLGEIYRDQFQSAARDEDGDLDEVIAGWTTVEVDVDA